MALIVVLCGGMFNIIFVITIISSTNRPQSATLNLAQYYRQQLAAKGHEAGILSLESLPADVIDTDLYGKRSAEFLPLQEVVTNTTKFIFIIPEYNGSFPGVLKVFIDACAWPESFYEKKAALVGVSSGKYGNIRGVDHFTGVCNYMHLHVMPLKLHIPGINKEFDADGNLINADTLRYTNEQIDKFIAY